MLERGEGSRAAPEQRMWIILRSLWQGWKAIALRIGHFQTRVILSLIYYLVLGPVALVVRLVGDPLGIKRKDGRTRWRARHYPTLSLEQAKRQ